MEKKKVIIIMILLFLIVGIVISFKVASDLDKEKKIKDEIKEISREINQAFSSDTDDYPLINEVFDRRVIKKGPYSDIEIAVKQYYSSLYNDLKNIVFLLDSDNFSIYLNSKNIMDDGPLFLKSRSNLNNSKAQIAEYYDKFKSSLKNNTNKLSYLSREEKKYYIDFYLELTDLAVDSTFLDALELEYDNTLSNIEVYNQAFDFLYANRDEWEIRSNELVFHDASILDEYNNVLAEFNKTKKDLDRKDE